MTDLLDRHSRTEPALLHLWFAGFAVNPTLVRTAWLSGLGRLELAQRDSQADEISEIYEPLAGQAARQLAKTTGVPFADLEAVLFNVCSLFWDPEYFDMTEISMDSISSLINVLCPGEQVDRLVSQLSDQQAAERVVDWITRNISLDALRQMISSVSDAEVATLHGAWVDVCALAKAVTEVKSEDPFAVGLTWGRQIAIVAGPIGNAAVLWLLRSGYGERVRKTSDVLTAARAAVEAHEIHCALIEPSVMNRAIRDVVNEIASALQEIWK